MKRLPLSVLWIAVLSLSACNTLTKEPAVVTEPETPKLVSPPADLGKPVPPQGDEPAPTELVVVELVSYQDPESGLAFDFPAGWMLDEVMLGSRAAFGIQLTSWPHEPGMVSEVPEGGTIANILVQQWDPKGDLTAFSEYRKLAWQASGFAIFAENNLALANGTPAIEYIVQTPDAPAYHLFSTLGENYLVVSGSGDLDRIARIAHSMRTP